MSDRPLTWPRASENAAMPSRAATAEREGDALCWRRVSVSKFPPVTITLLVNIQFPIYICDLLRVIKCIKHT